MEHLPPSCRSQAAPWPQPPSGLKARTSSRLKRTRSTRDGDSCGGGRGAGRGGCLHLQCGLSVKKKASVALMDPGSNTVIISHRLHHAAYVHPLAWGAWMHASTGGGREPTMTSCCGTHLRIAPLRVFRVWLSQAPAILSPPSRLQSMTNPQEADRALTNWKLVANKEEP